MTVQSGDLTLLALLLALRNQSTSLNEAEFEQLYEVGEQLEIDPDDWEFIQEGLLNIIAQNPQLNQQFQDFLTKLEALDETQLNELIPNQAEIEQVMSTNQLEKRGYVEGEPELETNELLNKSRIITQKVLKSDNPSTQTQRLNWLERVLEKLFAG